MELPPDLIADLRLAEQKRQRYVLDPTEGNARLLSLAVGAITTQYLPAEPVTENGCQEQH